MKKTYYLFNPGTLERKDNTLKFTPVEKSEDGQETNGSPRYLPIENTGELYVLVRFGLIVPCIILGAIMLLCIF